MLYNTLVHKIFFFFKKKIQYAKIFSLFVNMIEIENDTRKDTKKKEKHTQK